METIGIIAGAILSAGDGGGEAYHADAVHLDGSTYLKRLGGLSVSNGRKGFLSVWARVADPPGFYYGLLETAGFCVDLRPLTNGPIDHALGLVLAEPTFTNWVDFVTPNDVYEEDEWYHILYSWDVDFDAGLRRIAIYNNDILQSLTTIVDAGVAFDINYQDAPVLVGTYNESDKSTGDLSDLHFNTATSIVLADGTISEADRRNFISATGKPVDPAIAIAAYGMPAVLLSGDASTFISNQGNGGAFALIGSLTDASGSPSDS